MLFDVRTVSRDGWSVVSVVGEIDLATMPTLRQHLVGAEGPRVALDLSGVDHVEPVTFGVFIAAALSAARSGAEFELRCPPGRPRQLLAETGLDRILTVVDLP